MQALSHTHSGDSRIRLAVCLGMAAEAGVLIFVLALIYRHTALDLVQDWWNEPSLSYGFMIPPVALFFAWLDKEALLAIPSRPGVRGLWAVAAGCFIYLLGKVGAEFFLQRISMIIVLAGLIWIWWGS